MIRKLYGYLGLAWSETYWARPVSQADVTDESLEKKRQPDKRVSIQRIPEHQTILEGGSSGAEGSANKSANRTGAVGHRRDVARLPIAILFCDHAR